MEFDVRPIDELLELVTGARLVLLGEATHGTEEFYALRAEVTKRLISERGVRGVAVEADWPAAAHANRYVQDVGDDADARAALGDFRRFPQWMWRNHGRKDHDPRGHRHGGARLGRAGRASRRPPEPRGLARAPAA